MPGEHDAMCASMGVPVDPGTEYWTPEPTASGFNAGASASIASMVEEWYAFRDRGQGDHIPAALIERRLARFMPAVTCTATDGPPARCVYREPLLRTQASREHG